MKQEALKAVRSLEQRRKLFGTDGIRGIANMEPMTPETVLRLGRAVGHYFQTSGDRRHKIVIGKDTRLSGYMIENALASFLDSNEWQVAAMREAVAEGDSPNPEWVEHNAVKAKWEAKSREGQVFEALRL